MLRDLHSSMRFVGHEKSELMASRYENAISVLPRRQKEPIECDRISDNDAITWHNFTKTHAARISPMQCNRVRLSVRLHYVRFVICDSSKFAFFIHIRLANNANGRIR